MFEFRCGMFRSNIKSYILGGIVASFLLCSTEAMGEPRLRVTYPPDRAVSANRWIAVCGIISRDTVVVKVNGVDAHVSAGTFMSRNVQLAPGRNRIVIAASDIEGSSRTKELVVAYDADYSVSVDTSRIRQLINRRERAISTKGAQTLWTTPIGTAEDIAQMRSAMEKWHQVFYSPLRDDRPWVPISIPENGSWRSLTDDNVGLADLAGMQHNLDRLSWWIKVRSNERTSSSARVVIFCEELVPPHYLIGESTVTHRHILAENIDGELTSTKLDAETQLNLFAHIAPALSPPPVHLLSTHEAAPLGYVNISGVLVDLNSGRVLVPIPLDKSTKAATLIVSGASNAPSSWASVLDMRLLMGNYDSVILEDAIGNGEHFVKTTNGFAGRLREGLRLSRTESGIFQLSDSTDTRFDFDGEGILKQITVPDGPTTLLSYAAAGGVSNARSIDGNHVEFSQNIYGRLNSLTVNGRLYRILTDEAGRLEKIVSDGKDVVGVEYGGASEASGITAITRGASSGITLEYDPAGRLTALKGTHGTDTIKYDDDYKKILIGLANGNERLFLFDPSTSSWQEEGAKARKGSRSPKRPPEATSDDRIYTPPTVTAAPEATFSKSDVLRIPYTNHLGKRAIFECVVSEEDNRMRKRENLPRGRLLRFVGPMNKITEFAYDTNGDLTAVIDPEGNRFSFLYAKDRNEIVFTDPSANVSILSYKPLVKIREHMAVIGDADGNGVIDHSDLTAAVTRRFSGEGAGPIPLLPDLPRPMPLHTLAYRYDFLHKSVQPYYPFTPRIKYSYSFQSSRFSVQNLTGRTSTHRYTVLNRQAEHFRGLAHVATFHWAEGLLPLKVTDRSGGATEFTYNVSGQLTSVTDPAGNTETYNYNKQDLIIAFINRRGAKTRFSYDSARRLVEIIDPLKNRILCSYDDSGRLMSITTHQGVHTYGYDNVGRVAMMTDSLGHKTHFTYDNKSRLLDVMDAEKHTTGYEYDDRGRLTAIVDPQGGKISLSYGDGLQPKGITNPAGERVQLAYDPAANLVSWMNPSGRASTFRYDSRGNVIQFADTDTFDFTYDMFNRLTLVEKDGKAQVSILYDDSNRRRIVQLRKPPHKKIVSQYEIRYDNMYRPTTIATGAGEGVKLDYDEVGNIVSVLPPSGKGVSFQYDSTDRLVAARLSDKRPFRFAYDASGNRTMLIDAKGRMTTVIYDKANRPISMVAPDLSMTKLAFNNTGRVTTITNSKDRTTHYNYDKRGLLQQVTFSDKTSTRFDYDAMGNLTRLRSKTSDIAFQYRTNKPVKVTDEQAEELFESWEEKGILSRAMLGTCRDDMMRPPLQRAADATVLTSLIRRVRRMPVLQLPDALEKVLPLNAFFVYVDDEEPEGRERSEMKKLSRTVLRDFVPTVPDPWENHEQRELEFAELLNSISYEKRIK